AATAGRGGRSTTVSKPGDGAWGLALAADLAVDAGLGLTQDLGQEGHPQLPQREATHDDHQQDHPEHGASVDRWWESAPDREPDQQAETVDQLGQPGQLEGRDQPGPAGTGAHDA